MWNYLSVQSQGNLNEVVQISGSLMKSKVETGSQAKFWDQTTTFRTTGNDGILTGESDTGAIFQCTVNYDHDPITIYPGDRPEKVVWTYMWKCWTNICVWENTPVS
ncbi:class V chitinase [Penicillium canescens]|nr:class V chitinase [Penicillium canescens]